MTQLQIEKSNLANVRLVETPRPVADEAEILLKVERFGFSANNITYAVAGETLGYWQFFKPEGDAGEGWGVMPVWGFAEIVESGVKGLKAGERLFGYLPPSDYLTVKPVDVDSIHLFDGAEQRAQLPRGYNLYRRVAAEPGYDRSGDNVRMLLYPLYLTSFMIHDQLQEHDWYRADQVILISASSKTSIGVAYAMNDDKPAGGVVGLTSVGNVDFVKSLGLYDQVVTYDDIETGVPYRPSAVIDIAGHAGVLGRIHQFLGGNMCQTLGVGLTHWEAERRSSDVIKDRTEFFFAPLRVQQRMKEWGADEFNARSSRFVMDKAASSSEWLNLKMLDGLEGLQSVYADVLNGKAKPQDGFLIKI